MPLILILSCVLLFLGVWEKKKLKNIKDEVLVRIQVNGVRGKSTIVRMLSDLLVAGGMKVSARISGEVPQIFDCDNGWKIYPRKGNARIKEISQFMQISARTKPDVLICENMALQPEYQAAFAEIFSPQISIFTNFRLDHQEVMGNSKSEIAATLSFSLPQSGTAMLPDERKSSDQFKLPARISSCKILPLKTLTAEEEENSHFQFHLQMLDEIGTHLEINRDVIEQKKSYWKEKLAAENFIQALSVGKKAVQFLNLFTCNDVESTEKMLNYILPQKKFNQKIAVILACRPDRPLRTMAFLEWLMECDFWRALVIYGDAPLLAVKKKLSRANSGQQILFGRKKTARKMLFKLAEENEILIGMGNYLKSGEGIVEIIQGFANGN